MSQVKGMPVQMTDKGQKGQWTKAALEVKASDKKDYWLQTQVT